MHFTGKILIVFMAVLSILFMAMAGAVYTAHMNWRKEAMDRQVKLDKKIAEFNDLDTQKNTMRTDLTAVITATEQKYLQLDALRKGLEEDLRTLRKEAADLQVARKTASEQSLIAGEDAASRKSESDNLRSINHDLTSLRDNEFGVRIKLEDAKRALEVALDAAIRKNKELIGQKAILQQTLEAHGLNADVNELATKDAPPPGVDGIISDVLRSKKQGAEELVEVSIGSDDGLKKGHRMTVYSSGLKGNQRAKYLGQIEIVRTEPDRAVGRVIESSRNGVIQKGDNVSTKL